MATHAPNFKPKIMKINIESPEELLHFLKNSKLSAELRIDDLDLMLSKWLKIKVNRNLTFKDNLDRFQLLVESGLIDENNKIELYL